MLCEHCLIERTDNLEGIPGKTENGCFGLSLPWTFTISASFGQCFPHTAVYFETTKLALGMTETIFSFLSHIVEVCIQVLFYYWKHSFLYKELHDT